MEEYEYKYIHNPDFQKKNDRKTGYQRIQRIPSSHLFGIAKHYEFLENPSIKMGTQIASRSLI